MKKVCVWVVLALCLLQPAWGDEDSREWRKALVINSASVLLDITEYQGGVGFKVGLDEWFVRSLLGLSIDGSISNVVINEWRVGTAFEWHLATNQVQPYLGAGLEFSHYSRRVGPSNEDYVRDTELSVHVGPLFGAEYMVMENLGFFAEYQLRLNLYWPSVTTSVDGSRDIVNGDMYWNAELGLGNAGMLGICIYF